MAGYRNRMVHFYDEVTPEELYQIVQDDIKDIEEHRYEIIKAWQKHFSQR